MTSTSDSSSNATAEEYLRARYRLAIGRPQPIEYETAKSLKEFGESHGIRAWYVDGELRAEWIP
jgi:hypothetical protein